MQNRCDSLLPKRIKGTLLREEPLFQDNAYSPVILIVNRSTGEQVALDSKLKTNVLNDVTRRNRSYRSFCVVLETTNTNY